jgi:AcrR family transcriptional regulator
MAEIADAGGVSLRTLYRSFGTREALFRAAGCGAPRTARDRILAAALELVGRSGMNGIVMDELAAVASTSRATLYRLFPTKPTLFRELVRTYSPWQSLGDVIRLDRDRGIDEVIPGLAYALVSDISGRTDLILRMVSELARDPASLGGDATDAMTPRLAEVLGYLEAQMSSGVIRRMDPVIAFQLLAGPIAIHLATRPLAASRGLTIPLDDAIDEVAAAWLRAMRPSEVPQIDV